jgi:hypothetical protein
VHIPTKQENQVEHLGKCSRTTRFGTKARRITAIMIANLPRVSFDSLLQNDAPSLAQDTCVSKRRASNDTESEPVTKKPRNKISRIRLREPTHCCRLFRRYPSLGTPCGERRRFTECRDASSRLRLCMWLTRPLDLRKDFSRHIVELAERMRVKPHIAE